MVPAPSTQAGVLVVDDDLDIRETLREILEEEGFQVAAAANGQEALEYLREHQPPALILLDLMMPVMDGRQFRANQREDSRLAKIPVVVITAGGWQAQSTVRDTGIEVLGKPLRYEDLLNVVRRHVGPVPPGPPSGDLVAA